MALPPLAAKKRGLCRAQSPDVPLPIEAGTPSGAYESDAVLWILPASGSPSGALIFDTNGKAGDR